MPKLKHNKIVKLIFFGNYFYGICAIALAIEASLQQHFPPPSLLFFVLAFASTVLYYSKAYVVTETSEDITNLRSMWYARNHNIMVRTQWFFLVILIFCGIYFLVKRFDNIMNLNGIEWFSLVIFPIVSAFYYGVNDKALGHFNLRNVGWLKPFIIGYTWAGLVTVYPILFNCIDHGVHYEVTFAGWFLFIKNFMYITLLCILFDIKDYAMDYNQELKTVVIKLGLRKTLFYLIIPLCVVGLSAFLIYANSQHFTWMKILINTMPFLAIILVAYSMSNRRSIFYYLMVIDGLMLFKALCGITAMIYF